MRTQKLMEELRASLTGRSALAGSPGAPRESRSRRARPELPCGPAPADRELLEKLKAATIAQIGVGRAGVRLRTATFLKFLGDRAVAVEAVRSTLALDFAARLSAVEVQSEARDLDEFLLRPDLGRRLPGEAVELIRSRCAVAPDVQVVVGDGLSAHAVSENAPPLLEALFPELERRGLKAGTTVLVRRARMRTLTVVGEAVGARTAVILLGERPGLGTGDGMSAYLVFRPRASAVESDHEVVSNIHARGIPPAEAARKIADLLEEFLRVGASGVPRQAGAAPSPQEQARIEPCTGDACLRRDPYSPKRIVEREPRAPLAVSAQARCAG
ncbi:ethanolamine ammonia-lyase subunit EutC [bacterium]|nr:ethanolamine ammonia-lyase subunit EutC [bacterium]